MEEPIMVYWHTCPNPKSPKRESYGNYGIFLTEKDDLPNKHAHDKKMLKDAAEIILAGRKCKECGKNLGIDEKIGIPSNIGYGITDPNTILEKPLECWECRKKKLSKQQVIKEL